MNHIPKIIHQTWKESKLPHPFNIFANTWKELHPSWKYILWTDDMNRDFVKTHFPQFLNKYDSYPSNIQRVDAFRYLLLSKIGGVYVDIDIECLRNINSIIENESCVIGKEPKVHCQRFSVGMILCNAFMASTADNSFIKFVSKRLMSYNSIDVNSPVDVLNSTGPFLLTNSYLAYDFKEEIRTLNSNMIYPLTIFETHDLTSDSISEDMQKRIDEAYAVHYFWGSW